MESIHYGFLLLIAVFASYASADDTKYISIANFASVVASAAKEKLHANNIRATSYAEPDLLIAEPYGISRVNVSNSVHRLVVRTPFIGGIDYHFLQDRIYWSEVSTGRVYSRVLDAKGSAVFRQDLLIERSPRLWRPKALAVDYVSDKLYVLDSRGKKVHVFGLDGTQHSVIFDGYLAEPMDIAVDPHEGVMFIADGPRIIRVNMDGTSPTAIVGHRRYYIKSVSLDLDNKRVFWSDETYHRIKSAKYNGSDLTIVLKNEAGKGYSLLGPANLAFHDGHLYFYDDMWQRIASVQVNGTSGHADESTYTPVYDKLNVRAMRIIHPKRQVRVASPCSHNNGDCQQICLIRAKNSTSDELSHSCACQVGATLAADSKSCVM